MSDIVIKAAGLGKRYRLGQMHSDLLSERLSTGLRSFSNKIRRYFSPFTFHHSLKKDFSPLTFHLSPEKDFWALKDVSFEIKQGEVVGIIGRNGAGKSTLLKILSRITEPTEGMVELYGRVGSLLEVGTGFHPELTGRENIFLNGAILGMKKAEIRKKFDEIVAFAEVEKFLDTPVKRYSSGMYVRLAFAVAAHLEPEILLVDEVLAVGDAQFQKKCLGKMGEVAKEGRTVLFVSHNMTAIKSLCKRAIWLDKGIVVEGGEVGRIVDDYLQTGISSVLKQVWNDPATAPGNDQVQVHCAQVLPEIQDTGEGITVETPLLLEFQIWNHIPDAILTFTAHVFTIESIYVLAVGSDAKPRHKGLVKGTIKIPANFLNDNIYSVTLQVVKDTSSTLYLHPDILMFEVHDAVRTGNWFGKWPGVIRPKFEWFTQDVDEGDPHGGSG